MADRIIFLDFDGVLLSRKSWQKPWKIDGQRAGAHPDCVTALNRLIEQSGSVIVVSSTWREDVEIYDLQRILCSWGVTGKVLDKTPNVRKLAIFNGVTYLAQAERGREIQKWIDDYRREIASFVILDDDADMLDLVPFLVQTDFETGLTEPDVDRALEILCK